MLGAEGVGTYSYTLSMCKYFMLFALLGISDYGCKSVAAEETIEKNYQKRLSIYLHFKHLAHL